ncbi:MAG TPA: alpha/beta hydrolase [Candidatus Eisenbacteria bacterium]|nr:alpha/beta hydrolase [Candidatus Eisenbacteria bacterium]
MIHSLGWILAILLVLATLGFLYQVWGSRKDARRFPAPGRLVDIGTHRLHLLETGSGSPTILLEAGLMSTVLSWTELQHALSASYRVVSYDRAGLGWSDLGPMPRTADRIVTELHALLDCAKIPPPYILVGHSFGGLTMPQFAACYPDEVAGIVLVDPVAPREWDPPSAHDLKQALIGAAICRRASLLARIGLLRFIAAMLQSGIRKPAGSLVRLISRGAPGESGTVSSPWFAALPDSEKKMAAVFWTQPKFALTIASQLESLPASAAQTARLGAYSENPVCILSASTAPERRHAEHQAMAGRLPRGSFVLAANSNHWIMQGDLALVLRAIEDVIASRSFKQP